MDKLYFFALLGLALHVLGSFQQVMSKSNYDFKKAMAEWPWQKALISFVTSLISIVVLISTKDSFKELFPITTALHAVIVGYASQSILKKLIDNKFPKKDEGKQKRD